MKSSKKFWKLQVLQQSEGRREERVEVICGPAETRRSGEGNRQADAGDIAHPFRLWKRKPDLVQSEHLLPDNNGFPSLADTNLWSCTQDRFLIFFSVPVSLTRATSASRPPEPDLTNAGIRDASAVPNAPNSWSTSSTFTKRTNCTAAGTTPKPWNLGVQPVMKSFFPTSAPRPKAGLGTWPISPALSAIDSWAASGTSCGKADLIA